MNCDRIRRCHGILRLFVIFHQSQGAEAGCLMPHHVQKLAGKVGNGCFAVCSCYGSNVCRLVFIKISGNFGKIVMRVFGYQNRNAGIMSGSLFVFGQNCRCAAFNSFRNIQIPVKRHAFQSCKQKSRFHSS